MKTLSKNSFLSGVNRSGVASAGNFKKERMFVAALCNKIFAVKMTDHFSRQVKKL